MLERKFYFDHVYDILLVGGTKSVLAKISYGFDKYIVDGLVNLNISAI